MTIQFQVFNLDISQFQSLFSLSDEALVKRNMKRIIAERDASYPCRVSLVNAKPGERLILLSYQHQQAPTPYQSRGPIFIRENAVNCELATNTLPSFFHEKIVAVRVYNKNHLMINAEILLAEKLHQNIVKQFSNEATDYLHIHFAAPGCYACCIKRY